MVRPLEALADALGRYCGWHDPQSDAYQSRNPGQLPALSQKHPRNGKGQRVFNSFIDGYQALLFDLAIKCAGKSNTKLQPNSTLKDLVIVYGHPVTQATFVAKFLRHALKDDTLNEATQLNYFVEVVNGDSQ